MPDIRISQIQLIRVFARLCSTSFATARYATAGWLFLRMSMVMSFQIPSYEYGDVVSDSRKPACRIADNGPRQ